MNSSRIEETAFYSNTLGKEMHLLVYLPDCYDNDKSFPVLYFLHGRSGDETILLEAEINTTADQMIGNKEIVPMIIVCPRLENSRGINSSEISNRVEDTYGRVINIGRYEDYFIEEVITLIDQRFKTIKDRKGRFIGGASAGGYAALHLAFRHQDLFIKVGGHMPALELKLEEEDKPYFPDHETWEKYDPIALAKNQAIASDLKVYLDAGNQDEGGFYEGCSVLQKILEQKGINSLNHVFPGHHNVEYIKSNMRKYLMFYGN